LADTNTAPLPEQLRAGFLALLPRIQTHARIHTRHVRCPGRRDDLVAEAVAVAWKWYVRAAGAGKDPADFPAAFASLAASHARSGRRLCGQERAKDALSGRAQRIHGFTIQSLPECDSGVEGNEVIDALTDNTRTPPPEQAAFRIDFPRFLESLGEQKRRVANDLMLGERTQDAARKHDLSQARISQIRTELRLSWRRFHGEGVVG
jgi:DNA-directed RNA polymerase specialized sigma24 family protein